MKDLGSANKILGIQIHRDRNNMKIWLSQKNYLKKILRRFNILLLYVDDMLVEGPNKDRIQELKTQLAREFEMNDLGSTNKILRIQIH